MLNGAMFLFDYTRISKTEYGKYVFQIMVKELKQSTGACMFHSGDISRLNAKEIALQFRERRGCLAQSSGTKDPTPLVNIDTEFSGGIYCVGIWTNTATIIETLHKRFDMPDVEGYIGFMMPPESLLGVEDWKVLMGHQLQCPMNIGLNNGSIVPGTRNPFGL